MTDEQQGKDKKAVMATLRVLALALTFPSLIIGLFFLLYRLWELQLITFNMIMVIIVAMSFVVGVLMLSYAQKK